MKVRRVETEGIVADICLMNCAACSEHPESYDKRLWFQGTSYWTLRFASISINLQSLLLLKQSGVVWRRLGVLLMMPNAATAVGDARRLASMLFDGILSLIILATFSLTVDEET